VLVTVVSVAPAGAQRAAGPFSGVLGAVADAEARHTLDVRGSLFGAWDDTISSSGDDTLDRRFLRSGGAAGASGSMVHALRSTRFQWQSSLGSSLRLYGTDTDDRAATYTASTAINTLLSRRVSLVAAGALTYSPYYDFAPGIDNRLTGTGAFGGGFNVATAAQRNLATSVSSGFNVQVSRRDSVSVDGHVTRFDLIDQPDGALDSWRVGARWSHAVTRNLSVHAGFGRDQVAYEQLSSSEVRRDNFDFGIDYHDALVFTLTRRTSLSFSTSTSAIRWNDDTHFRVNGSAALTRSFGRSGGASLSYTRDTDFNGGFRAPLLRDSVSAGVSNQVGRRVSWSAVVGYQHGTLGFGADALGTTDSYNAGGGINMAVSRRLGLFTDYSFYRYEVPSGATVFASLTRFSRQSVTAGLSVWLPLISETRSFRDSR
jgi:hypothetical protein